MSIKNRLQKLEKQTKRRPEKGRDNAFTIQAVNYRAGISPDVKDTPGAIPVKFVDIRQDGEGDIHE
jgi:hypothetical protein